MKLNKLSLQKDVITLAYCYWVRQPPQCLHTYWIWHQAWRAPSPRPSLPRWHLHWVWMDGRNAHTAPWRELKKCPSFASNRTCGRFLTKGPTMDVGCFDNNRSQQVRRCFFFKTWADLEWKRCRRRNVQKKILERFSLRNSTDLQSVQLT